MSCTICCILQALQNRTIWIEEPDRGKMSHDQERQYSLFLPPTCPYEPEEKSVYVKCSVNPKTCQSKPKPPPYTPPQSNCSTCSPCSSYPRSPPPELYLHPPSCHPCSSPPPHYSPASRHQPCSPIENTVCFSNCSKIINTYPPAQTKNSKSTKHKISTYHYAPLTNINVLTRTSFGKYISHCSRSSSLSSFSTSASCSSPSSGKCKSVDEICKEKEKSSCGGSAKCEPQVPSTSCSPPKEKCGKRAQDTKCPKMKDEKKCPASCLPKEKCLSPSPPPAPPFNHGSSQSVCVPPRFAVPPPCPPREEAQEICHEEPANTNVCPLLLSMPKPPCHPAPLCPCPPPPKLPPGPCPCYPTPREISSISSGSNPCPKSKPKYSCPRKEDVYCPPDAAKQKCPKKTCKDNAKNKFKS